MSRGRVVARCQLDRTLGWEPVHGGNPRLAGRSVASFRFFTHKNMQSHVQRHSQFLKSWFVLAWLGIILAFSSSALHGFDKPRIFVLTDIENEPDDAMSW